MWWNNGGWGPMYGMWFMPVFGLLCMLILFYVVLRIVNRERELFNRIDPHINQKQDELLKEIKALRNEVEELHKKQKKDH
ncbi:hypothetical protein DGMP_24600 [Desulfomarina profundi]|uniref:Uncharacterized protein n=1 Tax=Desulfomarina profundi TaxID=2772557 RepID=A0A8D5FHL6_9BACT|nr:hypothetical protein [Desulfomarina profundi]BCL61767.1 hypothetical protein DGMP_24600 [Desulfomarina profundi]